MDSRFESQHIKTTNVLQEEENNKEPLVWLGRTFGILIGLILISTDAGNYTRIGSLPCRKRYGTGDALVTWENLLHDINGEDLTILLFSSQNSCLKPLLRFPIAHLTVKVGLNAMVAEM